MKYLHKISLILACIYCLHRDWSFFAVAFLCLIFLSGLDNLFSFKIDKHIAVKQKEQSNGLKNK